ncbi:MAG: hypothetical protein GX483_03045 [Actinomycetaceae bacterium]|nr:hypothetical protein [Actinomycetaceae bacterium]
MLIDDVPQWAIQAFVRAAQDAGASVERERLKECAGSLLGMWTTPERPFHNVRHLMDMLARVDTLAPAMHNANLVRLATWGHGLVFNLDAGDGYSHNGGEDEAASAEVAIEMYRKLGIDDDTLAKIHQLITQLCLRYTDAAGDTKASKTTRFDMADIDRLALYDAHFGTLATDPQRYKAYTKAVRAEYEHLSDQEWLRTRQRIVMRLLERKRIFLTPLGAQWEPAARNNLAAELERINKLLAQFEAEDPVSVAEDLPAADDLSVADGPVATADLAAAAGPVAAADLPTTDDLTAADDHTAAPENVASADEPSSATTTTLATPAKDEQQPEATSASRRIEKPAETDRLATPIVDTNTSSRSTLEKLDDIFTPGAPPRVLNLSEQKAAAREQRARETLEAIEEQQQKARAERKREQGQA